MAKYKESTAEGSSYVRCHTITIHNPLNEQPQVTFREEAIITIGGSTFKNLMEGCYLSVVPEAEITVLDPATNLPTGEVVTHARLYQLLYSAYLQTALARDAFTPL